VRYVKAYNRLPCLDSPVRLDTGVETEWREVMSFFRSDIMADLNVRCGFCSGIAATEEDTDAILVRLQHLRLHHEPCLGLGWCQQGVYEWNLEGYT